MRMKLTLQGLELAHGQRLLQLKFLVPSPLKILVCMRGCQNNHEVPDYHGKNVKTGKQCGQRAMFELLSRKIPRRHQTPPEAQAAHEAKGDDKNIPHNADNRNPFGYQIQVDTQ